MTGSIPNSGNIEKLLPLPPNVLAYINSLNFNDYYPNDYIIIHGNLINKHLYRFILNLAEQISREDGYDTDATDYF